jgi:PAS domain S-box-containing protein
MGALSADRARELALVRCGRVAAAVVLVITAVVWVGWSAGIQALTRISPRWPPTTPWTAVWLAALAVAVLVLSGSLSPVRKWFGRGLAAAVGGMALVVLAEYVTRRTFGVDQFWFGDAVRSVQPSLPGRPGPQTASSALLLSITVALNRDDLPWTRRVWTVSLAVGMVMPFVTILAYVLGAVAAVDVAISTGMALLTAVALLLLGAAVVLLNPEWLLARSDRSTLARLGMILAGFPLIVGFSRRALLALGLGSGPALTFAIATASIVLGAAAYRLSRREHALSETRESDRALLLANLNGMLDPQVLLEAVRDADGRVVDFIYWEVNRATCDYLGLSRDDLVGTGLLEASPGVAASGLFADYVRCVDTGEAVIMDDFSYDNEILEDTRRYDLRAARATPTSITLTWRDVTERFRTAQLLAQARDLQRKADSSYRKLLDNSGIGMGVLTPDGTFQSVNPAMCDFFGYDAETLVTKTWQELTAPDYLAADLRQVDEVLAGCRESFRMTKQYIHADGHLIWGDLSVSSLRAPSGDVESFLAQIIDITAEVETREQLAARDAQNRELARRLQAKAARLTADLDSAASYVTSILPGELQGPVRVTSSYLPSQELAGDSFDYRWIDEDHLIAYLIDVSGHGIEPALLSVSVHNLLRSGTLPRATLLAPDKVLTKLNWLFQMDRHGEHYLTMWFGVYQASSRTLRYASAGAPPAFATTPDDGSATIGLATYGQPLGMFDDTTYTTGSYTVPPGCRILLFSDGSYEDAHVDGRQLSLTDFGNLFTRLAGSSLDDLVDTLKGLTPSGSFSDDCSLVRLEFD